MASLPLPSSGSRPSLRLVGLIAGSAGAAAAILILLALGDAVVAASFLAAALVLAGTVAAFRLLAPRRDTPEAGIDWALANVLAESSGDAIGVTDRAGRLVVANARYEALFGGFPIPPGLPLDETAVSALGNAGRAAWRDGTGRVDRLAAGTTLLSAEILRAGDDMLVWRFRASEILDEGIRLERLVSGTAGDRLAAAGVMAVLLSPEGRIRAANRVFRARAMGHPDASIEGRDFARFLVTDSRGLIRFEREGMEGIPLRLVQIPVAQGDRAPILLALLDEEMALQEAPPVMGNNVTAHVRALVSLLPFGMALIDREGRFVHMNDAFSRAARVDESAPPLYPGDLVVREDKAALADAIRRFVGGAARSTDISVRLARRPEEPIALTIAGARGLGEAAVLLCIKDTGEEGELKRQIAQATKMQAVGQLAGGVAHDFNNILTAILGHCDLMLMRHTPGDSDYDDIQQIRANSNRAASLTRQLLAFSRQQTLRPQVLQLPDVISEVSNLLKRLLGERVKLEVKHGRGLGAVRADPGQLEQVIINLAVNARDAMIAANPNGGGTLTIETFGVCAADVRRMEDDVLPVGDYTALRVSDTGTGIPPEVLPKIFEPFFTTKELGKGTGLGLSTVYGIIKQSGGYIFAKSPPGGGAVFTIYLPVHAAGAPVKAPPPKPKGGDLWGSGTILLVEDEEMVRTVAERALARQGYTVLTAENGEAALEILESRPELVLLISDVVMPTMDGPTMVRHARKLYPDLPILFMSGYAEEQLRRSIDLDNVAFLPKPFSVQQLAEATRDILAMRAGSSSV